MSAGLNAREMRVRVKVERVLDSMLDDGYHFPNEYVETLDACVVDLGGKSRDPHADAVEP